MILYSLTKNQRIIRSASSFISSCIFSLELKIYDLPRHLSKPNYHELIFLIQAKNTNIEDQMLPAEVRFEIICFCNFDKMYVFCKIYSHPPKQSSKYEAYFGLSLICVSV